MNCGFPCGCICSWRSWSSAISRKDSVLLHLLIKFSFKLFLPLFLDSLIDYIILFPT